MLRAALLPCLRRAGRTKDAVEVGLVSYSFCSFSSFDLSNRPSNFARGETITLHLGRKKKKKDFLISIRIAGGPVMPSSIINSTKLGRLDEANKAAQDFLR